jgi:hypothetical protein
MNNEQILSEFHRQTQRWDCRANDDLLLTNSTRPLSVEVLKHTASRLAHRLAENQRWVNAFNTLWAHKDYAKYRMDGNADILTRTHHGETITAESLLELMENPNVVAKLSVNAEQLAQEQAQSERARLISEITLGKTTYGAYRPQHGDIKWYPSSHLAGETTERLVEIHQIVTSQRRAVVERQGGAPQVKSVQPTAQPETFTELINPTTGVEYTASELKRLDRSDYRRILCLPSGQVKPLVATRITQILKGLA